MEALKKIVHMFFSNLTYHNLRKNFTKLRLFMLKDGLVLHH